MELEDPAYADAGMAAARLLADMRSRTGVPGATAAVAVDGRLVWSAGVGYADLDDRSRATPRTSFRIGSTSKAMTATLLARLVAAGELSLDDPVGAHWRQPLNQDWAGLTLRRLMSHTAGMPGYENNTDIAGLLATLCMRRRYASINDQPISENDRRL